MIKLMDRHIQLNRNVLIYRLLSVFGGNGLMTSVIYFFFTSAKSLGTAQALFLVGLAALAKAASEVPTGVIADKFSRKYSIVIGYSVLLLSWVGLLTTSGFWALALFMVGAGVGGSFISGADDALLYDSLKELSRSNDFKSIFNLSASIELVGFAVTVLIGGLLGNISLYWPVVANLVFLLFSIAAANLLIEPSMTQMGEKIEQTGYLTHTKISVRAIFSKTGFSTGLLASFVSLALITAIFRSTKHILSPLLDQKGYSISTIGIIIFVIIIIKAIGAFVASRVSKPGNEIQEVLIGLGICVIGLFTIVLIRLPIIQLMVFVIMIGFDNVILSNLQSLVNDKIESSKRSTILSILSLFSNSSQTLFLTSFGWIIGVHLFNFSLLFTAGWLSLSLVILLGSQIMRPLRISK